MSANPEWSESMSDVTAEKYDRALAAVQQLLKVQGVPSYVVHTHGLKLFGNHTPFPPAARERYAPELVIHIVIHRGANRAAATVTVGPRSGSYLVSTPNGPDIQVVQHPAEAADLVIAARSGGRT